MKNFWVLSYKTLVAIGLVSILNVFLYNFANPAKAQSFKPSKKPLNRQETFLKCGFKPSQKKEIRYKQPLHIPKGYQQGLREYGGTRCGYNPPIHFTALIPEAGFGTTLTGYPTIFIYVPDIDLKGLEGKFSLYTEGFENGIYSQTIVVKEEDSIITIDLSDVTSLPPLEVNKIYYWNFRFINNEEDGEAMGWIGGIIERIKPNSAIKYQLDNATSQGLPATYADNGVWYDAIASLAKLRCSYPKDLVVAYEWRLLLQQERFHGDIYKKLQCSAK